MNRSASRPSARTFPCVVKTGVIAAAVLLVLAACVLAIAAAPCLGDDGPPGAGAAVVGASATGVFPALTPLGGIAAIGDGIRDSGAGVYPALTATGRLVVPEERGVRRARRWLATRRGKTSFAVLDEHGALRGVRMHASFPCASLTKAMVLVAFLRLLERREREPSEAELLSLGYMIRLSDNSSADSLYRLVGDARMRSLARRAGMRQFRISGDWAQATASAADQARLFLHLDRLVPRRSLPLARTLLETVSRPHSWGIPAAARPRWRTFFKGGWRPEAGAEVVNQAALLESGGRRVGLAVMTRDDPTMVYGQETIEGTARRLLAGSDWSSVPTMPDNGDGWAPPVQAGK